MSPLSATKATLAALAGGASLSEALGVGTRLAPRGMGDALESARAHVDDAAFQRDAVQRIPFEPRVVGTLLAQAPPGSRREVAILASRALEPETRPVKLFLEPAGILITAVVVLLVATVIRTFLGHVAEATSASVPLFVSITGRSALAQALAGLGLVTAALSLLWRRGRPSLAIASSVFGRRSVLSLDRLLLWVAAGDEAGVVPGAVMSALRKDAPPGWRQRLGRLEVILRGASRGRAAAEAILRTAGRPDLVPVAVADLAQEPSGRAVARLARLVPFRETTPADLPRSLGYLAMGLLAAAVYVIASEIYVYISTLGGLVP